MKEKDNNNYLIDPEDYEEQIKNWILECNPTIIIEGPTVKEPEDGEVNKKNSGEQ